MDRGHERDPRLFGPLRTPWQRPLRRPGADPDPEAPVDREREIQDFKPEKFWTVHARFSREGSTYDGVWFKNKQNRLSEKEKADRIAEKVRDGTGTVRKAQKKTATEKPSPLRPDRVAAQRQRPLRLHRGAHAARRPGALRGKKLITYPRTSSRHSKDMVGGLKRRVEAAGRSPNSSPFAEKLLEKAEAPYQQAHRGRIEGHRPPRHRPHQQEAVGRLAVRRGEGLRPGGPAFPRRVFPRGPLREHDRRNRGKEETSSRGRGRAGGRVACALPRRGRG